MASNPDLSPGAGAAASFRVGRWLADAAVDSLTLEDRIVKLEPRTMRLLQVLAARPGQVIGNDELLDTVWSGVVVTGQSLYQAIAELRAVLKADTETGAFIANVPRKGYRLVAPVSPGVPSTPPRDNAQGSAALPIAVLPFRDLGLSPELGFLRETLLGGLILELSRQPNLAPVARGTMLSYAAKGAAPRQVAAELAVRYVLDGTISQQGDGLHLTCEFVDAQSDAVLASEAIELPATQWPSVALQVVGRLARAARLEVTEHAARAADPAVPGANGSLTLAMRAWVALYCRPQTRETNDRAWTLAAEALRLDDSVAAAWNALAFSEWRAAQYGWSDAGYDPLLADAVSHARRATALAPSDPDGYYTLGLSTYTSGELEQAEASLRHCLAISASYAPAIGLLGLVRAVRGHPEETAGLCARAFALSPREPLRAVWHWTEACALSMLGRDADACERAHLGIAANPDYPACHLVAAVSAYRLGRPDAAARHVAVLRSSAFSSIARLRRTVRALHAEPWASDFLADLHRAGLP